MFNSKTKSVLLAVLVALAMAGGAMAAAPTIDTESTDTSTTTELNDGDTQAYNATTSSLLAWSADSANSSIEITQDGDTVYEASPDSYNDVSGTYYYNVSLADDGSDYSGLEVGAGESVTLNVTLTNDTEVDSPDTTNISYTYEHTEESAWIASEAPETEEASGGLFGSLSTGFGLFSSDDSEDVGTVVSTDSTSVTENTSEVQLDTLDSNLTDAFGASTSDASEGDLIWTSYSQVSVEDGDSQYVPVFYQSANDGVSWLNASEDAYATISSDGETMTVHNPNALLGDEQSSATLDVTTVGDEALGWGNARSTLSSDMYDASATDVWTSTFGATDLGGNPEIVTDALEG